MKRCKYCKYRSKRPEGCWCLKNHYYPNSLIIKAMGCSDFKKDYEQLSLFEKGGKE